MGGMCASSKSTITAGHASHEGASRATSSVRKAECETVPTISENTVGKNGSAPSRAVTASAAEADPAASSAAALDTFTLGDGCGAYLLESSESNGTLISQYAKQIPSSEKGLLLLQVKPPPYNPIPETRFVLQGGTRIIKQNIIAMKASPAQLSKYCELVLEFVKLAQIYKAYLWSSTHLHESAVPFCVLFLTSRKETVEGLAAKTAGGGAAADATGYEKAYSIDVDKNAWFVHYLEPHGSVSFLNLKYCGILPLTLEEAQKILPTSSRVDSLEDLRKTITSLGGCFVDKAI